ncbi:collagen alpha-1(III) chain-like [Aphelocoma coerulescens]|uniref:collagen alpha-1(III) chain-like n=1 Tax=Aphelocoma coerulescens TaxID=39617 RepID=UPI003604C84A
MNVFTFRKTDINSPSASGEFSGRKRCRRSAGARRPPGLSAHPPNMAASGAAPSEPGPGPPHRAGRLPENPLLPQSRLAEGLSPRPRTSGCRLRLIRTEKGEKDGGTRHGGRHPADGKAGQRPPGEKSRKERKGRKKGKGGKRPGGRGDGISQMARPNGAPRPCASAPAAPEHPVLCLHPSIHPPAPGLSPPRGPTDAYGSTAASPSALRHHPPTPAPLRPPSASAELPQRSPLTWRGVSAGRGRCGVSSRRGSAARTRPSPSSPPPRPGGPPPPPLPGMEREGRGREGGRGERGGKRAKPRREERGPHSPSAAPALTDRGLRARPTGGAPPLHQSPRAAPPPQHSPPMARRRARVLPPPPCQSQPAAPRAPPGGARSQRHRPPSRSLRRAAGARGGGPSPAPANHNPRCKSRPFPQPIRSGGSRRSQHRPAAVCPSAPCGGARVPRVVRGDGRWWRAQSTDTE